MITGMFFDEAVAVGKAGFLSYCVCVDCLEPCEQDLKIDGRVCLKCNGKNVASIRELLGRQCPKCKTGTFIEVETGLIC